MERAAGGQKMAAGLIELAAGVASYDKGAAINMQDAPRVLRRLACLTMSK